jgi:hypothetical protein
VPWIKLCPPNVHIRTSPNGKNTLKHKLIPLVDGVLTSYNCVALCLSKKLARTLLMRLLRRSWWKKKTLLMNSASMETSMLSKRTVMARQKTMMMTQDMTRRRMDFINWVTLCRQSANQGNHCWHLLPSLQCHERPRGSHRANLRVNPWPFRLRNQFPGRIHKLP